MTLTLNRLLPGPAKEVDAADAYAYPRAEGPYLRANMVASVDGAAALAGRVGTLTGPADQQLFQLLRSLCDVLLVGAGTVRAEGYGPVRTMPELRARRQAEGQAPAPRLAVLTRALDLDLSSAALTEAAERPLLITTGLADPDRVRAAERVAEVLVAGDRTVDLAVASAMLLQRGLPRMLSEGGPHLLGELYGAGLVDELCLAVSPLVALGAAPRITAAAGVAGAEPAALLPVHLAAALERDEFLFLRYTRG